MNEQQVQGPIELPANLIPRRNGWCLSRAYERAEHRLCPVEWGWPSSTTPSYRCDCPCHGTPEEAGRLW